MRLTPTVWMRCKQRRGTAVRRVARYAPRERYDKRASANDENCNSVGLESPLAGHFLCWDMATLLALVTDLQSWFVDESFRFIA